MLAQTFKISRRGKRWWWLGRRMAKDLPGHIWNLDPHWAGHKRKGCLLCFFCPFLIEFKSNISSEKIIWSNKHSKLVTRMKNNSGERAWKCIVHNLLWHMFLLLDFHWLYYLGRNLFSERKGYSADGSILEALSKRGRIISDLYWIKRSVKN